MKLVLLLIAVTAVSAHWTHDESFAREIGPPPGEEDVDVANLGEEAQTGAVKQYRITFGTSVVEGTLGASMSQFKVHLKGAKMKLRKTAKETGSKGWVEDKNWRTSDDAVIRYYQGVGMPYAKAKKEAPALHPGMTPLVDTMKAGCSNAVKGKVKPCPARVAKDLAVCEPMSKACKRTITMGMVAYTQGKVTQLINGINYETGKDIKGPKIGPIQRGQFMMEDVGKIVAVKISELKSYTPSDPCYSKASGFKRAFCSSPWRPAFVKISTNDVQTGVGDGTYYIAPCDAATLKVGVYVMKGGKGQPDVEKGPVDLIAKALYGGKCPKSFNGVLTKCQAQSCEEEMDTKLGLMDATKYEFAEDI